MKVKEFFDPATYTLTFIAYDQNTKDAIVIDPVWDYDPAASKVSDTSVQQVISWIKSHELHLHYIMETHAHADHLSGSQLIKKAFPKAKIAIGARIREVQGLFKGVFNFGDWFKTDGSQFDKLLEDNEVLPAGSLKIKALYTPGHTPACLSYLVNDNAVFTGDALFMPDYGTGRCDFPAGSSLALYDSVQSRLYTLADSTKVYVGHDYQPGGRPVKFESTIGEEKQKNIQLQAKTSKDAFVNLRNERDKTLAAPRLLLPSVQVNINGGHLPAVDTDGKSYLKLPVRC